MNFINQWICRVVATLSAWILIVGWYLGFSWFTTFGGDVSMKEHTCFGIGILSIALLMQNSTRHNGKYRILAAMVHLVALSGMFYLMTVNIINVYLHEFHILTMDKGGLHTLIPGLPSVGTMIAVTMLSVHGIYIALEQKAHKYANIFVSSSTALISITAIFGHANDSPAMYLSVENYSTGMAIPTAIFILAVSFVSYTTTILLNKGFFKKR